jgi:hypothetical protein
LASRYRPNTWRKVSASGACECERLKNTGEEIGGGNVGLEISHQGWIVSDQEVIARSFEDPDCRRVEVCHADSFGLLWDLLKRLQVLA